MQDKRGFNAFDVRITNALLDLYAKCGCIASMSRFFQEIPDQRRNLVSWTSTISGFAMNGMGREAHVVVMVIVGHLEAVIGRLHQYASV